jgi:hypothetical protein
VARTSPLEKPGGKVTFAVAVDNCKVPASGVLSTTKSGTAPDITLTCTTVPTGTFVASIPTATGPD